LSVAYLLLNAASSMAKFCTQTHDDHVLGSGKVLGFMSIGVVVTKIMTFFYRMHACRPSPAQPACALLSIAQALGRWPYIIYKQ